MFDLILIISLFKSKHFNSKNGFFNLTIFKADVFNIQNYISVSNCLDSFCTYFLLVFNKINYDIFKVISFIW